MSARPHAPADTVRSPTYIYERARRVRSWVRLQRIIALGESRTPRDTSWNANPTSRLAFSRAIRSVRLKNWRPSRETALAQYLAKPAGLVYAPLVAHKIQFYAPGNDFLPGGLGPLGQL